MKRILFLITIILSTMETVNAYEQNQKKLDSLLMVLKSENEDTSKVYTLNAICRAVINTGEIEDARKYGEDALALAEKISFKKGMSDSYFSIGNVYWNLSDYPKALEYDQKALTITEQAGNKYGVASILNNMGNIYYRLSDYPKALEIYQKAIKIYEKINRKNDIAGPLHNIGMIYAKQGNYSEALNYYLKAKKINIEVGNQNFLCHNVGQIGEVYFKLGNYQEALINYLEQLKIAEEIGDKNQIAESYSYLGAVYQKLGNLNEALYYETKGSSLALEIGAKDWIKKAYGELAVIDSSMNDFKGAYENHKLYMLYNDSMFNTEKDKKITSLSMKYEFDKVQDSVKAVQAQKDAVAKKELQKQRLVRNGFIGGFAVMVLFAAVFFRQRNRIKKGKKRSDELLLNILPEEVAEELKENGSAEAKMFDDVTVMFTDFKGFTIIAEKLSAKDLVGEINYCFSAFDNIIHKYGIEKIKTIGDSYMAVGGLPVANKTHANDVVKAAIEIKKFMEEHKEQRLKEGKEIFEIRIGIHTGPVVAGIVGIKKFAYDIWGDTVNLASRMESSGEAGKVNISGSTYELIKNDFTCTYRGKIQAKNKGEVDMYFVNEQSITNS